MGTKLKSRLSQLIRNRRSDSGFTMTDMLVASVITSVVVASGGVGVASMMDASTTSNAKSERRVEINHSLDFISSEIKVASQIDENGHSKTDAEISSNFTPSSEQVDTTTVSKALVLTLPGLDTPVVYYSAQPVSGKWSGPRVVYRWGPALNSDGTYEASDSSTWKHEALIDKIDNSGATPACGSGWTANGSSGFYACVDPNGKVAQINQIGQIKKLMGQTEAYGMSLQAGTKGTTVDAMRSNITGGASVAALPSPSGTSSSDPSSNDPSNDPSDDPSDDPNDPSDPPPPPPEAFTSSGGVTTFTSTSTMTVRNLGGDITCGAGGVKIPVSGTINVNTTTTTTTTTRQKINRKWTDVTTTKTENTPISGAPKALGTIGSDITFNNVPANAKLDITGAAGNNSVCNKYSYSANSATAQGSQVLTLVDGDTVPLFTPFGGQRTMESFMTSTSTNPLTGLPLLNATTGKVTLAKNQVIYLFELGTTSKTSSAYDMQDLVVLATITPTSTTTEAYTKCNNGVGNGSDGCTPGNSTAKDEKLYNIATGALTCTPATGNPCKENSSNVPAFKLPSGVTPKG
jgi:hypothetical protein